MKWVLTGLMLLVAGCGGMEEPTLIEGPRATITCTWGTYTLIGTFANPEVHPNEPFLQIAQQTALRSVVGSYTCDPILERNVQCKIHDYRE